MKALWLLAVATPLSMQGAGSVTQGDLAQIRVVIHRQIDGLRHDGACGAVQRPARVAFRDLVVMSGEVVQQVAITDRAGGSWLAYFSMQRLEDGSWRANGCHLVQPGRTISA